MDREARAPKGKGMYHGPKVRGQEARTREKARAKKVRAKAKVLEKARAATAGSQVTSLVIAQM